MVYKELLRVLTICWDISQQNTLYILAIINTSL